MSVFDQEDDHDHSHEHKVNEGQNGDDGLFGQLDLRRRFTAQCGEEDGTFENVEILFINKKDLYRMKTEFREEFKEFFESAIEELGKTITVRLCAMDMC